ncbi:hypothetical protein SAMN05216553_102116 [Lentzea fradiae]|uniref:SPFH domain / Band 7 family protein n=1 Tax=Lentzea fradiae TaxID=200378 RepID=A0A1G7M687_9PSEU|nr:hypothetical protein [Lentzea fradiae]SDF57106.1 hypothetical protein SAMN05216553_102116 [Lentzea fradiae]
MTHNDNYPVCEERTLPAVKRRVFTKRRDVSELPPQNPGTVLVFEVGGRYEAFSERRHLTGAEEAVIDAVTVSVVDVRARLVDVELAIPSANPGNDFLVHVRFGCTVTDAEVVVASRLTNAAHVLREYLRRDRPLVELGCDYRIDELNEVRKLVNARVTAYCRLEQPRVPGLAVELSTVEVLTPGELRTHGGRMQEEAWEQQYTTLKLSGQRGSAEFLRDMISQGPEMADAMALSRGEITAAQIAAQKRADTELEVQNALRVLSLLGNADGLNHIGYDPAHLIDKITQAKLGVQPAPQIAPAGRRRAVTAGQNDDKPGFAPNEDDLA